LRKNNLLTFLRKNILEIKQKVLLISFIERNGFLKRDESQERNVLEIKKKVIKSLFFEIIYLRKMVKYF